MASIGDLNATITADASGFTSAVSQVVQGIGEISSGLEVIGAISAGIGLEKFVESALESITKLAEETINLAMNWQSLTVSIAGVMEAVAGNTYDVGSAVDSVGGAASKTAQRIADEMDSYKERVDKINESIADSTSETQSKIADLISSTNSQLEDMASAHADRLSSLNQNISDEEENLADRKTSRQESIQTTLEDMQTSQDEKDADKRSRFEASMANETNTAKIAYLRNVMEKEIALDDKLGAQKMDIKKTQLEKRAALEDAKDAEASAKKIAQLKDQIEKEDEQYADQTAKLDKRLSDETNKINDEYAKRLRNLKEELAKEEEAHIKSLRDINDATSGGGSASKQLMFTGEDDTMRAVAMTKEEVGKFISMLEDKAPVFQFQDLGAGIKQMSLLDMNVKQLGPSLLNIATASGESFNEVVSQIDRATVGGSRGLMVLARSLGITAKELKDNGAAFDDAGNLLDKGSYLRAIQKIGKTKFGKIIGEESQTAAFQIAQLKNEFEHFALELMGIDEKTKAVIKGGLFDVLQENLKKFVDFMVAHKDDIIKFLKELGTIIGDVAKVIIAIVPPIVDWIYTHRQLIKDIGIGLAVVSAMMALMVAGPFIILAWIDPIGKVSAAIKFLGEIISGLVGIITSVFDKIKKVFDIVVDNAKLLKETISKALDFNTHSSPSVIEKVTIGINQVKDLYASLGKMTFQSPAIRPPPSNAFSSNYSYVTYNQQQSTPVMNNTFNVSSQASANNIADYLGFMLEHKGMV